MEKKQFRRLTCGFVCGCENALVVPSVVNSAFASQSGFSSSIPGSIKGCCGESPKHDPPNSSGAKPFCALNHCCVHEIIAALRRVKYKVCWPVESRQMWNRLRCRLKALAGPRAAETSPIIRDRHWEKPSSGRGTASSQISVCASYRNEVSGIYYS